jgi:DNA polymerase III subunit epsilon
MKIVYIDLETTGTDENKHAIHQIAGYVEKDWQIVETFNYKVRPRPGSFAEPKALEIGHVTAEQIKAYPPHTEVYAQFIKMLARHINKFDKKDKAFFTAYNASFDNKFMRRFFEDNNDAYFGSWFWSGTLDVMGIALNKLKEERHEMLNFQLATVAQKLGITVASGETHDAMNDIRITREMYHKLEGRTI